MDFNRPLTLIRLSVYAFTALLIGCASGSTTVKELHYYAVPNGTNTNYYRLRVEADTKLGVTEYRSGWFPARSVDSLYGNVSDDGGIESMKVKSQIEREIDSKVLFTTKAWLEEAAKHDANQEKLKELLVARRRILAYPIGDTPPFDGAFEIEYNPVKGINIRFADEKLVFLLGSNPDGVVGEIANFAEENQTIMSVQNLSIVMEQRVKNDIAAQQAVETVNREFDSFVHRQIMTAQAVAADQNNPAAGADAVRQIDALITLLNSIYP
jgi:hypothetical protein